MKIAKRVVRLLDKRRAPVRTCAYNEALRLDGATFRMSLAWTDEHLPVLRSGQTTRKTLGAISRRMLGEVQPSPTDEKTSIYDMPLGYNASGVSLDMRTRMMPAFEMPDAPHGALRTSFQQFSVAEFLRTAQFPTDDEQWQTHDAELVLGVLDPKGCEHVTIDGNRPHKFRVISELPVCFAPGHILGESVDAGDESWAARVTSVMYALVRDDESVYAVILGPSGDNAIVRQEMRVAPAVFASVGDSADLWQFSEPQMESCLQILAGRIPQLRDAF